MQLALDAMQVGTPGIVEESIEWVLSVNVELMSWNTELLQYIEENPAPPSILVKRGVHDSRTY